MSPPVKIALDPYGLRNHALVIWGVSGDQTGLVTAAARSALEQLAPSLERQASASLERRKVLIQSACERTIQFFGSEARVAIQEARLSGEQEEESAAANTLNLAREARRIEQELRAALPQPLPRNPAEQQDVWIGALLRVFPDKYRLPSPERERQIALLFDVWRRSLPEAPPSEHPLWQVPSLLPPVSPRADPLKLTKASEGHLRRAILAPSVVWAARQVATGSAPSHEDLTRIETTLLCSRQDALKLIALVLHANGHDLPPAIGQKPGPGRQLRLYLEDLQRPTHSDAGLARLGAVFDGDRDRIQSAMRAIAHGFGPGQRSSSFLTLQLQLLERHIHQLQRDWSSLDAELLQLPPGRDAIARVHDLADHVSLSAEHSDQLDQLVRRLENLDSSLQFSPGVVSLQEVVDALEAAHALPGSQLLKRALMAASEHLASSRASLNGLQPEQDQRAPWVKALLAIFSLGIAVLVSWLIRAIPYRREKARLEALVRSDLDQLQRMTRRLQTAVGDWAAATRGTDRAKIEKAARTLAEISEEVRGLSPAVVPAAEALLSKDLEASLLEMSIQHHPLEVIQALETAFAALREAEHNTPDEMAAGSQECIRLLEAISELSEPSREALFDAASRSPSVAWLRDIPRLQDPQDPLQRAQLWRSFSNIVQDRISPELASLIEIAFSQHRPTEPLALHLQIGNAKLWSSGPLSDDVKKRVRAEALRLEVDRALASFEDDLSEASFVEACVQCMSDVNEDPAPGDERTSQQFLRDHLDDPQFSRGNLIAVRPGTDPTMQVVFRKADDPTSQVTLTLSNRASSNMEFRGEILKNAIKNQQYERLRELIRFGHLTASDQMLRYLAQPLKSRSSLFPENNWLNEGASIQPVLEETYQELVQIPIGRTSLAELWGVAAPQP